ncbi:MAG: zinc-binding dehydrogenase [Chloroflexi bacterium]|nr:zinc-binding dehydrogenase [Chloroflexota bacterium]
MAVSLPSHMRAVVHHEFGAPDVLVPTQLPVPWPGPTEVLLRVLAVSVDYVQLHIRKGGSGRIGSAREPGYGLTAPPYVRGGTVCGEVVAVGAEAADVALGSRHLVGGLRPGSYVEYGVVDAAALRPNPEGSVGPTAAPGGFTPAEAAAFNYAPVAYHTLRVAAGLTAGETVLIHAAAGGTGVLAVQLAKSFGARVIATAGGPAKVALVRELGADVVIDYRAEDFVPAVLAATDGGGVDVVWESVGGEVFTRSLECLAEGGRMVSFGSNSFSGVGNVDFYPFWTKNIRLIGWGGKSNAAAHAPEIMEDLLRLAAAGALRPVVAAVLPLEQAAEAHRMIEAREAVGKVVLAPDVEAATTLRR